MKKIYTLPYALVIAALNTASSYADVFTSGDLQYTTLDENTCEITKSFAGAADLVIPPKATDEATGKGIHGRLNQIRCIPQLFNHFMRRPRHNHKMRAYAFQQLPFIEVGNV